MADYRKVARRKARKYGLDPKIFERQIQAESNFNPRAKSPAGASGIAQIMPGTAKAWGVNPMRPRKALDAAAKNMAQYVKKYGSYENALRAYNAGPGAIQASKGYSETNAYVAKILNGMPEAKKLSKPQRERVTRKVQTKLVKGGTKTDIKAAILDAIAQHASQPGRPLGKMALENISSGAYDFETHRRVRVPGVQAGTTRQGRQGTATAPVARSGGRGRIKVAPTANRPGAPLSASLRGFLGEVSGAWGNAIDVGTGSNHSRLTVNGNVSDHWDGNGADIPANANTPEGRRKGDAIAYHAFRAAGVPEKKARLWAKNGGLYNVTYKGKRVQVIWKTSSGGNHYDHVHIGIR